MIVLSQRTTRGKAAPACAPACMRPHTQLECVCVCVIEYVCVAVYPQARNRNRERTPARTQARTHAQHRAVAALNAQLFVGRQRSARAALVQVFCGETRRTLCVACACVSSVLAARDCGLWYVMSCSAKTARRTRRRRRRRCVANLACVRGVLIILHICV